MSWSHQHSIISTCSLYTEIYLHSELSILLAGRDPVLESFSHVCSVPRTEQDWPTLHSVVTNLSNRCLWRNIWEVRILIQLIFASVKLIIDTKHMYACFFNDYQMAPHVEKASQRWSLVSNEPLEYRGSMWKPMTSEVVGLI